MYMVLPTSSECVVLDGSAQRPTQQKLHQNVMSDNAMLEEFEREALPHMNSIYTYALRLCRDRDDANDLVQETYVKAFRFFESFERGTNIKAWLFRILKNTFINKYRKDAREPDVIEYSEVEEFYESIRSTYTTSTNLETQVFDGVFDDDVTKALESLPDDFKTVVLLCDVEGFTYEEIAEFINCPIGTVRSRLHRARNLLGATLLEYAAKRGFNTEDYVK